MDLWGVFGDCSRTGSKETACGSLGLWSIWEFGFFAGGRSAAERNDRISMAGIHWRDQFRTDAFGDWNDQQRKCWHG